MRKNKYFNIYDVILSGLKDCEDNTIRLAMHDECWAYVKSDSGSGIGMFTPGNTVDRIFPAKIHGTSLNDYASAIKSWNLEEASFALAAINSHYNTLERLNALHCEEPFENYCTAGMDFTGKTVGVVGHMNVEKYAHGAKQIFIFEKNPKKGDYPDSACDYLLPECDVAIITGSSLINKTLPHLLELTRNAYTVLTGPSVPMCEQLLKCGIDRISGFVIENRFGLEEAVLNGNSGSPYKFGKSFLISR